MKKLKRCFIAVLSLCLMMFVCVGCSSEKEQSNSEGVEIDLDLSKMSVIMSYTEATNMNKKPTSYVGKVIKMKGVYDTSENGMYHFCLVKDNTNCCFEPIEIIMKDGVYPEKGSEFTIVGTFNSYDEGGQDYYGILDAEIE